MGYINGMIVQSDGSMPHVVYIMETLARTFPNVIWKIGGKVNRTTWGGTPSAHQTGRACDIYLDASDPLDKKLGELLFHLFSVHAAYLKVDHTIWDGRMWSTVHPRPARYTGSGGPHRDHVHVAFLSSANLNGVPTAFDWMCKIAAAGYVLSDDRAADRQKGVYGQAFDPRRPNVRRSATQRRQDFLKSMGMEGADDP